MSIKIKYFHIVLMNLNSIIHESQKKCEPIEYKNTRGQSYGVGSQEKPGPIEAS